MQKTKVTKASEIKRQWHLIDAQGQILGRMATEVAKLLMGKDKPSFSNHLDVGDYVVVLNSDQIKTTGRKIKNKLYQRHSGYPGGFKEVTLEEQMTKDSRQVIRRAVSGMLPKNKLRDPRLKRLKIFPKEKHPYEDKFKAKKEKKGGQ